MDKINTNNPYSAKTEQIIYEQRKIYQNLDEEKTRKSFNKHNLEIKKENNFKKMSSTLTSTQNDFEEKLKECENKPEELSKIHDNQEIETENQEPKFESIDITIEKLKKQAKLDFEKMTGRQREETLKTCFSRETLQNLIPKLDDYMWEKTSKERMKIRELISFLWILFDRLNGLLENIKFSDVPGNENYSKDLEGKFEFALDYAYPYLCKEKKKEFLDIVRDYDLNSKSDYSQEHKLIE